MFNLFHYSIICFGGVFFVYFFLFLKISRIKSKAERSVFVEDNVIFGVVWIFFSGLIASFFLPYPFYICFLIYIGFVVLGTFLSMLVEKIFKSWIGTYTLKCPECRQDMKLLSTAEEQKFESPKTATEVEAGGKDFEYWKCTQCNHSEQFEVVLPEGLVCPKCGWYSVKRTKKDIPEKNMIQISDKCLNPKCTYTSEQTKKLQDSSDAETFLNVALTVGSIALDVASSSSSGSGFSGGGGSFGGGGSSGSW